ncbi:MAG: PP2C family protein-serine/threonine phosphatase [Promethearchaeota archaeon]
MEANYGLICDVGGKNKGNQDSSFFLEFDLIIAPGSPDILKFSHKCIFALICDGVSASEHGEKGSSFVVRTLPSKIMSHLFTKNVNIADLEEVIRNAIQETNRELIAQFSGIMDQGKVPKTTLVGALIIGQWIWVFNIGDSRIYLIKDDQISQVSEDHIGSGAQHEITQAMGQIEIAPDIKIYNWAFENEYLGDKLAYQTQYYALLCSDGLSDKVSPDEIKEALIKKKFDQSMQDIVQKLFSMAIDREIKDNVSIIAINLKKYFENLSKIQKIQLNYP